MVDYAAVTTQMQERPETVTPKPAKRTRKKADPGDPVEEYKRTIQLAERLKVEVEKRRVEVHRDFIEELREHVGITKRDDDPADVEQLRARLIGAH